MKRILLSAVFIVLSLFQSVDAEEQIDLALIKGIPNAIFLTENIIGGGVPSKEALEEMKRQGFRSIIDLRMKIEGTALEKAYVEKLKIKYFNIPIRASNISDEHMKQFSKIVIDPDNRPALVHCAVGGRVNILWRQYKREKKDDSILE